MEMPKKDSPLSTLKTLLLSLKQKKFDVPSPVGTQGEIDVILSELTTTLEQRFKEQVRMKELTENINKGLLLEEVLNQIYDSFKDIIPYDRIGFSLLDDDGRALRAHWTKSETAVIFLRNGFTALMDGSSLQTILDTGRPRIINDLEIHLRDHPTSVATQLILKEGVRSSLTCPIVAMGKPVGFLFFSSRNPGTYADAHIEIFQHLAEIISMTLEKARLYAQILTQNHEKNLLIGMVVHDLRSPIGTAISSIAALQQENLNEFEEKTVLENMAYMLKASLEIIETMLDVSAIEAGVLKVRFSEVPLRLFLDNYLNTAQLLTRRNVNPVELQLGENLPEMFVFDPKRIEQALTNLVVNAAKFSNRGGRIVLRADMSPAGELALAVGDEGPGISESVRAKLFKAFSGNTKSATGERGVGLGLAIVKRLIDAHRGRINVASQPGAGAIFSIHIPPLAVSV